ncbi:CGP-CTERM sorting domain-containing protein [Thermococcus piezophilus]
MTCKWNEPVFKVITPPWARSENTKSKDICGPALLVGLVLVPLLVKQKKR